MSYRIEKYIESYLTTNDLGTGLCSDRKNWRYCKFLYQKQALSTLSEEEKRHLWQNWRGIYVIVLGVACDMSSKHSRRGLVTYNVIFREVGSFIWKSLPHEEFHSKVATGHNRFIFVGIGR